MLQCIKRLLLAVLIPVAVATSALVQAGDTLDRVTDFKTLTVGMSTNQPPMNMLSRDGKLMGFDVDLARALANAMSVKLEIKQIPFGGLMNALQNNEVDMIISGMAITPERSRKASFVGPYMMSGKSILTRNEVLAKATNTETFNRADLKLAGLKNSTSAAFITEAAPEATLIEVDNYDAGVQLLLNGEADGMVADMVTCVLAVLRHPGTGLTTLKEPLTVEPIGIAISADDPQFLNLVQNYVDAYAKLGVLAKLREKWLENTDWVPALP